MSLAGVRLILDTNALLRGLAKPGTSSGKLVTAIATRTLLLLTSRPVIDEYRTILLDPIIQKRHRALTPIAVEAVIRSLTYLSERIRVHARFDFPRDRMDEKFLALAIEGEASHLITFDDDLLTLATSHNDAAKRLRQ